VELWVADAHLPIAEHYPPQRATKWNGILVYLPTYPKAWDESNPRAGKSNVDVHSTVKNRGWEWVMKVVGEES
jgi:hypothetical protein